MSGYFERRMTADERDRHCKCGEYISGCETQCDECGEAAAETDREREDRLWRDECPEQFEPVA
jgi:hypothetical protein